MGLDLRQRIARQLSQKHEVSQAKAGHRTRSSSRCGGISSPGPDALIEESRLRLAQIERTELPALEGAVRFGNPRLAHQARSALGWQIAGVRQAMRDAVEAGGEISDVAQMSAALEAIEARVAHLVVAAEGRVSAMPSSSGPQTSLHAWGSRCYPSSWMRSGRGPPARTERAASRRAGSSISIWPG